MPPFQTHFTPNPNSIKITTKAGPFIESGMVSFHSEADAAGHPLGAPLCAVPGVANVFALPQFVTITKHPDADWDAVLDAVEQVLAAYFEQRTE